MSIVNLTGGLLRTCRHFTATNYHLRKSAFWDYAIVQVNNVDITSLYPTQPHWIEMNFSENVPSLYVNDMIVYQQKSLFKYNIMLCLNKDYPQAPYASIFNCDMKTVAAIRDVNLNMNLPDMKN